MAKKSTLFHHDAVQRVDTLSLYQVRQPLNTGSTKRWRNYEKHLGPLREALAEGAGIKGRAK